MPIKIHLVLRITAFLYGKSIIRFISIGFSVKYERVDIHRIFNEWYLESPKDK